jgi:DNA-binding transcriptional LysR family regulator
MADPLETSELLAFAKTVESRSLSRAASELRIPRATVSRRLARLEERLSTRLLRRTTRSMVLTDAGEALYRHARIVLDAVQHAEASVLRTDGAIRGDLRVSAPPIMSRSFYSMICGFARRHPEVRLQVHLSAQIVDLAKGDYDVALRASPDLQPGLVGRVLSREPLIGVAAPSYLAARGTPRSSRDLRSHRCLMGFGGRDVPQTHWPLGGAKVHVEGSFFSNDMTLLCAAAVDGLGIAVIPMVLVRRFLETGALVQVLPGILESRSQLAVVYLEREFVPPQVRAFVEATVEWAEVGRPAEPDFGWSDLAPVPVPAAPSSLPAPVPKAARGRRKRSTRTGNG